LKPQLIVVNLVTQSAVNDWYHRRHHHLFVYDHLDFIRL
jgi:hypothetical protein